MNKRSVLYRICIVLLAVTAICQFVITQYFTIFQGESHLDIDSSWEYLKTIIGSTHNTVIPYQYMNITSQPEVEHLLITVPLYKMTGNIWLAFGIENSLITLLSLLVIYKISNKLNISKLSTLVIINLFNCPFLANGLQPMNDLGYYSCLSVMSAHYNVAVLGVLLALLLMLYNDFNKHSIALTVIATVLYAYLSMSKGMSVLVWFVIPLELALFIKMVINNDGSVLLSYKAVTSYILTAGVIIGRFWGNAIGFSYADSRVTWIKVDEYIENLGNILLGYPLLFGGVAASDVSRSPLSFSGFAFVFGIIISIIFFISVGYVVFKFVKNKNEFPEGYMFILVYISSTILVYSLLVLDELKEYFDIRYLIPSTVLGFFLVAYFIDDLSNSLIIKKFGMIILLLAIIMTDLYSDYFFAIYDNGVEKRKAISETISETDAKLVYFWDNERTLLDIERIIRVTDHNRFYKSISNTYELESYGDYNYYDDSSEYKGPTVLVTKPECDYIDSQILKQYEHLADVDDISIWYSRVNPIDLKNYKRH